MLDNTFLPLDTAWPKVKEIFPCLNGMGTPDSGESRRRVLTKIFTHIHPGDEPTAALLAKAVDEKSFVTALNAYILRYRTLQLAPHLAG